MGRERSKRQRDVSESSVAEDHARTGARRYPEHELQRLVGNQVMQDLGRRARFAEVHARAVTGAGRPIDPGLRQRAERILGVPLEDVRIHHGLEASRATRAAGARAYTLGRDIVAPSDRPGALTLAHEVAHTAQAPPRGDGETPAPKGMAPAEAGAEREAHALAPSLAGAGSEPVGPPLHLAAPGLLYRNDDGEEPGERGEAVRGPLPPGTRLEQGGLIVDQIDEQNVIVTLGLSGVQISGYESEDERYTYYIEPEVSPDQRAIRIAHTPGVHVERWNDDPAATPSLVVHTSEVFLASAAEAAPGPFGDILEMVWGDGVVLQLDDSMLEIEPLHENARYAWSVEPGWSGPDGKQKIVYVVATPGVRVSEDRMELPESSAGDLDLLFGSGYGRRLVTEVVRVQDPALVPEQGTPIDPAEYIGETAYQKEGTELFSTTFETIGVTTGTSGVTIRDDATGARIRLSARDPEVGASYAYQVVSAGDSQSGRTEIRAILGPGVHVAMVEPLARAFTAADVPAPILTPAGAFLEGQEGAVLDYAGIDLQLYEVPDPALVPPQGSPIDTGWAATHGWSRGPDEHTYETTTAEELAYTTTDVIVGFAPGLGEVADAGEFIGALATGRDRWGRDVGAWEITLMGVGTLLPLVGSGALRGGVRAARELATAASRLGRSVDEIELLLRRLDDLDPEQLRFVRRAQRTAHSGGELSADDAARLERLLSRSAERPFLGALPGFATGRLLPPEDVTEQLDTLRRTGAVGETILERLSPEELAALDRIRHGLPSEVFTSELVELLIREGPTRRNPLHAIYHAGITPEEIRALGLTRRAGAQHAYRILRGGRRGGAPGYHALIAERLHQWGEFQTVVETLSRQQAGAVFEHWVRRHVPWAGRVRRMSFDASDYGLSRSRTSDIWLSSDGTIWELKYYTGRIPTEQAEDLSSLVGRSAPDGTPINGVRYVFPNREVAELNYPGLSDLDIEVRFLDPTGVMRTL